LRKEHNITLWQMIAAKLGLHMIVAACCILIVHLLVNQLLLPVYLNHLPQPPLEPTFFQIDLQKFHTISEEELLKNDASLLVLNENMQVIVSRNSDKPVGFQYGIKELTDLLLKERDNHFLRTDKFTDDSGQSVIVILQADHNILDFMRQTAQRYSWLMTLLSCTIVLLACVSFVRSIYKPLQENLNVISNSIAKIPHDTAPVDISHVPLQETRMVLSTYNTMLQEMERTKKEKADLQAQSHRLIANLSHDLKSPMTNLRGYVELLEQEHLTEKEQRIYLGHVHSNISALNSMVELLGEQVQYQHNDYPLHLERRDMNDFLREICANYYTIFEQQGFSMEIDIMETPIALDFDVLNMRRVYANLLENALGHNPTPTQVQITTAVQSDCYLVQIKDNGVGIAPENQDKIFEPFYQGDLSRTKQHSGLGLFVVQQILQKHGASIQLEHDPAYKTVFTIRFPLPKT